MEEYLDKLLLPIAVKSWRTVSLIKINNQKAVVIIIFGEIIFYDFFFYPVICSTLLSWPSVTDRWLLPCTSMESSLLITYRCSTTYIGCSIRLLLRWNYVIYDWRQCIIGEMFWPHWRLNLLLEISIFID